MPRYALALALCVAGATALGAAECQTPECEEFEGDNGLCPEHIGPPCPRNYVNNMTDYTEGASLKIEADLREFMNQSLYTYLGLMVDAFPPSSFDTADVFNGVAGRALVALRLYERFGNASHLDLASQYIEAAVAKVGKISNKYVGHNWGPAGTWSIAAAIRDRKGDSSGATDAVAQVQSIFEAAPSDDYSDYDDWDSGRAGLLYSAAFLENHFGHAVIDAADVLAVAHAIVARGARLGGGTHLEFISPIDGAPAARQITGGSRHRRGCHVDIPPCRYKTSFSQAIAG